MSIFIRLAGIACVAAALASPSVRADEKEDQAIKLFDQYIEATGGQAAYDKIKNRVTKGNAEIVGQGITLALTTYVEKPNKSYVLVESDAIGKVEQGCDGKTAWEKSTVQGARIKEGKEAAQTVREGILDQITYWRNVYSRVEYAGEVDIDGKKCAKVLATPKPIEGEEQESPSEIYFDLDTHYVFRIATKAETPLGTIPVKADMSDYREVDGLMLAHKVTVTVLGSKRVVTTESVEHNVDLPADRFALPEDVQQLLKKQP